MQKVTITKMLSFAMVLFVGLLMYLTTVATKPVSFGQTDSVISAVTTQDSSIIQGDTIAQPDINLTTSEKSDTTFKDYQSGIASWYGDPNHKLDPYHGRTAASGVTFDTHRMWCAHKSLPFGSIIRVSNKDTSVYIQVVDRGPFVKGRIIDLSWAAAQSLGIKGTGKVDIELVLVNGVPLITDIDGKVVSKKKHKKK